ncbi:MAG TPA: nuclear transport factor 2 family protein [Pyrinomonadaceae bacterium]|nr:nuclear transport factor 2 family protein [Pyrinomonadaceae bacterium]
MKYTAIRLAVSLLTFIIGTVAATLINPLRGGHTAPVSNAAEEQEVLSLERTYIQANLEGDTATLNEILADDFDIRTRWGRVTDKAQRLALLDDPYFAFEVIRTDNVRAAVSGDTAVVTGDIFIRSSYGYHNSDGARYRYTREYEKRDGRWQIVTVYLTD